MGLWYLHWTGANAAGGKGDEVGKVAIVGAHAARAAESKGDGNGGMPQLELHATGAVEGKCGVKGNAALRMHARMDN